jgi:translocation and assembly module TamB
VKSARRTLLILAGGSLLLFLLVIVLGQSDLFLRWLVQRPAITKFVMLDPADIRGDLFGPIEIDRATLQGPDWSVELQGFALAWRPLELINRRWVVDQLVARQVHVAINSADQTSSEPQPGWSGFSSPIDIDLRQVSIGELITEPPGAPEGRLENIAIAVSLVGDRVALQHLAAQHPRGSATATGTATLSTQLPMDLELDWQLAELPMEVAGHAAISGDLQQLVVVVETQGDVVARSNGTINFIAEPLAVNAELRVDRIREHVFDEFIFTAKGWLSAEQQLRVDLDWRGLTWPGSPVSWQSPQGKLEIAGYVDDLSLTGSAEAIVQLPNEPDARWQLSYGAQVTPSLISISEVTILGQGTATLHGSYDLTSTRANFGAEIKAFNPGLFAPQWPGSINGTVSANATPAGWNAQLGALAGELRGEPLTGQGELKVASGDLTVVDANGTAQLNWAGISTQMRGGRTDQQWQLSLDQQIAEVGKLDPRFAGRANIKASLVGDNDSPTLTLELSTNPLVYLDQPFSSMDAGLTGIISADGFQGQLQRLDLTNDWLAAQLQSQAPLAVTRADGSVVGISLQAACLVGDGADVCISATTATSSTDLQIDIRGLQLAVLDPFLAGVQAHGEIVGAADLQFADSQVIGGGRFSLTQGSITTGQEQSRLLSWQAVTTTVTADGKSLTGELEGDLGNADKLAMDFTLAGQQLDQLAGRITANTKQLNALRIVLPEVKPVSGELHANLTLAGTLSHPVVNGQVGLRNAVLEVIDLGITLEQTRLLATLAADRLNIDASAQVEEGSLSLNGALTSLEPLGGEFTLRTENLRFINSPEAELFADATLTANITEPSVAVTGRVNIPRGHIKAVPGTAVSVSDDQVIVGQLDRPDSSEPWRATGALQLNLGPELNVDAVGVTGNVNGTLELTLPESGSPSGSGEITLSEGNFEVFRQVLAIERGGLVFSGGPVTNPGLDIRASRQIGEQTVGVLARGPAGNPVIELFAEPALSTADTLSYLTLGKPVNNLAENEQGIVNRASDQVALSGGNLVAAQLGRRLGLDETSIDGTLDNASLVLGKYLSPQLYVSYGISLAQATDALKLRFQLSRRWSLQAESGVTTSADLIYTIDR